MFLAMKRAEKILGDSSDNFANESASSTTEQNPMETPLGLEFQSRESDILRDIDVTTKIEEIENDNNDSAPHRTESAPTTSEQKAMELPLGLNSQRNESHVEGVDVMILEKIMNDYLLNESAPTTAEQKATELPLGLDSQGKESHTKSIDVMTEAEKIINDYLVNESAPTTSEQKAMELPLGFDSQKTESHVEGEDVMIKVEKIMNDYLLNESAPTTAELKAMDMPLGLDSQGKESHTKSIVVMTEAEKIMNDYLLNESAPTTVEQKAMELPLGLESQSRESHKMRDIDVTVKIEEIENDNNDNFVNESAPTTLEQKAVELPLGLDSQRKESHVEDVDVTIKAENIINDYLENESAPSTEEQKPMELPLGLESRSTENHLGDIDVTIKAEEIENDYHDNFVNENSPTTAKQKAVELPLELNSQRIESHTKGMDVTIKTEDIENGNNDSFVNESAPTTSEQKAVDLPLGLDSQRKEIHVEGVDLMIKAENVMNDYLENESAPNAEDQHPMELPLGLESRSSEYLLGAIDVTIKEEEIDNDTYDNFVNESAPTTTEQESMELVLGLESQRRKRHMEGIDEIEGCKALESKKRNIQSDKESQKDRNGIQYSSSAGSLVRDEKQPSSTAGSLVQGENQPSSTAGSNVPGVKQPSSTEGSLIRGEKQPSSTAGSPFRFESQPSSTEGSLVWGENQPSSIAGSIVRVKNLSDLTASTLVIMAPVGHRFSQGDHRMPLTKGETYALVSSSQRDNQPSTSSTRPTIWLTQASKSLSKATTSSSKATTSFTDATTSSHRPMILTTKAMSSSCKTKTYSSEATMSSFEATTATSSTKLRTYSSKATRFLTETMTSSTLPMILSTKATTSLTTVTTSSSNSTTSEAPKSSTRPIIFCDGRTISLSEATRSSSKAITSSTEVTTCLTKATTYSSKATSSLTEAKTSSTKAKTYSSKVTKSSSEATKSSPKAKTYSSKATTSLTEAATSSTRPMISSTKVTMSSSKATTSSSKAATSSTEATASSTRPMISSTKATISSSKGTTSSSKATISSTEATTSSSKATTSPIEATASSTISSNKAITFEANSRGRQCSAFGCKYSRSVEPDLTLVSLPAEKKQRKYWLRLLGRFDLLRMYISAGIQKQELYVCEHHFDPRDLVFTVSDKAKFCKMLKNNAIPTRNMIVPVYTRYTPKSLMRVKREIAIINFHKICETFLSDDLQKIVKSQTCAYLKLFDKSMQRYLPYKLFCLNLFHTSPEAYAMLENALSLPPVKKIKKSKIPFSTGLSEEMITTLKWNIKNMNASDKLCAMIVGRIDVKPGLYYNIREDRIIGFADLDNKQSARPANGVIALLAQGIVSDWTQPIALAMISDDTDVQDLSEWIDSIMNVLLKSGLNIKAFVSDLDTDIMRISKKKCIDAENPFFFMNDKKIYFFYDVSQLMQAMHHDFLANDFHYENNRIAKLKHIVEFYWQDVTKFIRQAIKLTPEHFEPSDVKERTVRLADEIFSEAVGIGISTHVDFQQMDQSATDTAQFILLVNKLKEMLTKSNFFGKSSQESFLSRMVNLFNSMKIFDLKGERVENDLFKAPFEITVRSVLLLMNDLKTEGYKHMKIPNHHAVRRFEENILSKIVNATSKKPTCQQCAAVFRSQYLIKANKLIKRVRLTDVKNILLEYVHIVNEFNEMATKPEGNKLLREMLNKRKQTSFKEIRGSDYRSLPIKQNETLLKICGHLLSKCLEYHPECDTFRRFVVFEEVMNKKYRVFTNYLIERKIQGAHGLSTIPCDDFIFYVERLEQKFCDAFDKRSMLRYPIASSIFEKVRVLRMFPPPCCCFPFHYLQKLFIRLRLFFLLKHNNVSLRKGQEFSL